MLARMKPTPQMPPRRRQDEDTGEELVPITIRFPISLRRRALATAQNEDRSFASLVLQAVDRYVTEREQQSSPDAGK